MHGAVDAYATVNGTLMQLSPFFIEVKNKTKQKFTFSDRTLEVFFNESENERRAPEGAPLFPIKGSYY